MREEGRGEQWQCEGEENVRCEGVGEEHDAVLVVVELLEADERGRKVQRIEGVLIKDRTNENLLNELEITSHLMSGCKEVL